MVETEKRPRRFAPWVAFVAVLAVVGLCVSAAGLALVSVNYSRRYAGRIYPGVHVYDVDLGGMTLDEAAEALRVALPDPTTLPLTLRSGDRVWQRTWADLGLRFDPRASARVAYRVGREGTPGAQAVAQLRAYLSGWRLSPVLVLPSASQTRASLRALAPDVTVPPVNAGLIIEPDGVAPVPAEAGRELDVEETASVLPHAVGFGPDGLVLDVMTRQVEPTIGNPGAAQIQAETLLAGPFTLAGEDRLTGFSGTWTLPPSEVAGWLVAQPVEDEDGARLALAVREDAVRASLETLNSQLAGEVAIDIGETLPAVRAAVEATERQAVAALTYQPYAYTVQPGDTMMSIAREHGFPVWRLIEANPNVNARELRPGQQIVIPSLDVLFPYPLIFDRRIVVDLSDQRLYAYEGDALVFDFIASTGIASSPTITGTFQVLSKEEEAYASSWDLWMPHFIGIYRSGPDFTNGIHGLPTLSNGTRLWEGYLGHPVSYGCIVLGLDEAAALYQWAELGVLVVIQD